MDYKNKYLEYKKKYVELKKQNAGAETVGKVKYILPNSVDVVGKYKEIIQTKDFELPQITNQLTQSPILILDNFIEPSDCDKLIESAEADGRFKISKVTKNAIVDTSIRSSESFVFEKSENPIVVRIENKVCRVLNISQDKLEKLQVTKYSKNNFYTKHYDFSAQNENKDKYANNDRVHTIIVYLNDLDEVDGGATYFHNHKIRVYPFKGRGIYFTNKFKQEQALKINQITQDFLNNNIISF
jgi:hypothetical protein